MVHLDSACFRWRPDQYSPVVDGDRLNLGKWLYRLPFDPWYMNFVLWTDFLEIMEAMGNTRWNSTVFY